MTSLQKYIALPPMLKYKGYIFIYDTRIENGNIWTGYFLHSVYDVTRYKRQAFKNGYWFLKNTDISSNGSNYLFKVLIENDYDEFMKAVETLYNHFKINNIPLIELNEPVCIDTNFTEIQTLNLLK